MQSLPTMYGSENRNFTKWLAVVIGFLDKGSILSKSDNFWHASFTHDVWQWKPQLYKVVGSSYFWKTQIILSQYRMSKISCSSTGLPPSVFRPPNSILTLRDALNTGSIPSDVCVPYTMHATPYSLTCLQGLDDFTHVHTDSHRLHRSHTRLVSATLLLNRLLHCCACHYVCCMLHVLNTVHCTAVLCCLLVDMVMKGNLQVGHLYYTPLYHDKIM